MKPNIILASAALFTQTLFATEPPKAIPPTPSKQQMACQHHELLMFSHFCIKTYYPSEDHKVSGEESPSKFNPEKLDAKQLIAAAKAGGSPRSKHAPGRA